MSPGPAGQKMMRTIAVKPSGKRGWLENPLKMEVYGWEITYNYSK